MDAPIHKQALPALAIAVLVGYAAHRANVNAAVALGVPVAGVALLVVLAITAAGSGG